MTTLKSIQYRPLSRVVWLFSSLLFFVGCGFQLKGSDTENGEAQLDGMAIQLISSRSRSELTREVSRALTAIGLVLVTDAEQEALLVLTLQPEQFSQRNVSLTAQARAAELELTLAADFTLVQPERDRIDARATVTRQMLNDPRNVVGKTEEIRLLREEMRRDLAAQIARRLSHSLAN
ncbi:MAG: LPS assembly lipoprotein LptE [Luminiphilus sp.]|nr:LPS assembly lipoprotein LptE [Luminiphilus sp.]MDG2038361.1 LPS assembly lipoprotein LptE [Luminiphilus sp.]